MYFFIYLVAGKHPVQLELVSSGKIPGSLSGKTH
jgi:hypothetical protein